MKIVNRKSIEPTEPYQSPFICSYCGSELIAEADDVKLGSFGNYIESWNSLCVQCPVCDTVRELGHAEATKYSKYVRAVEREKRVRGNE